MRYVYNDGGRRAAGFKGTTGDCGVQAVSIVTGIPYAEVYEAMNIAGSFERKHRGRAKSSARGGIWRKTLNNYLESHGFKLTSVVRIGTGCIMHLRKEELPVGKIICRVSKHYVAVIDGVVHDTHDCTREGTRCIYGYWAKEDNNG